MKLATEYNLTAGEVVDGLKKYMENIFVQIFSMSFWRFYKWTLQTNFIFMSTVLLYALLQCFFPPSVETSLSPLIISHFRLEVELQLRTYSIHLYILAELECISIVNDTVEHTLAFVPFFSCFKF